MHDLKVTPTGLDFSGVRAAMQSYVDQDLIPGASWALLRGTELIDVQCVGWADREQRIPLRTDHIFRAYSNSKLATSCAILLLMEQGALGLDDPVEKYLPQLANRQVLRPGATTLADTEPARQSITIRQLLTHSSGLGYGLLDVGTPLYKAYLEQGVRDHTTTLAQMIDVLAGLPLSYQPGTRWEYSIATDVLGRVVEVVSGLRFDAYLQTRIFDPLGLNDTGFVVPAKDASRLVTNYMGASLADKMQPGLRRIDELPYPGAYLQAVPRLSGGGGLVTTLPDALTLVASLLTGSPMLLRDDTRALMMRNHLLPGVQIGFPAQGTLTGRGFGLGGAVTFAAPASDTAADVEGEFWWGGAAGTQWWVLPTQNLAGVFMTQRHMAFWHPVFPAFRHALGRAMAAA